MLEIQGILQNFASARKSLEENNTKERLMNLTEGEIAETRESLERGDVENLKQEIADSIIFLLTIANLHGFDMGEEILTKIAYNTARYQASDFDGSIPYEEARLKGKAREKWVKPMFYNQDQGFTE